MTATRSITVRTPATVLALVVVATPLLAQAALPDTVSIRVALDRPVGELEHVWAWFGYDEPNYT